MEKQSQVEEKRLPVDDKRRELLQNLIVKLGLPFSATDILPVLGSNEKKRDRSLDDVDGAPLSLMQSKYLRLGEREIERNQTVVGFAVSKNRRLECQIRFNFCGNERDRIAEAMGLFRNGISKLRIFGILLVKDELLSWLLEEFPLLVSVKFQLEDPLCNQLSADGFSTAVSSTNLIKLHINFLPIERLSVRSPSLQVLTLRGMTNCCNVDLMCPRLSTLELDFVPTMQRTGPLHGLVQSIAACAGRLNWLCVNYPFKGMEEFEFLKAIGGNLQNLSLRLSTVEVLASLPQLSVLELFCDGQPDLSRLRDWKHLKVLKLHGQHRNLSSYLQETASLTSLLVEGCSETELKIISGSLEAVSIRNCMELVSLELNCPRVTSSTIENCPKLQLKR